MIGFYFKCQNRRFISTEARVEAKLTVQAMLMFHLKYRMTLYS